MGFFSRKEKSPEEKLVRELVGNFWVSDNLIEVLNSPTSQSELQKIVKEAWKNGASANEIQKVYDENLARFKYDDKGESISDLFAVSYKEVDLSSDEFTGLSTEISEFLEKMNYEPYKIYDFGKRFKCVVEVKDGGSVFITKGHELNKELIENYASFAYNCAYYSTMPDDVWLRRHDDYQHQAPPTYGILIYENVFEEDIPKLIKGDWAGQTNKIMIYNPQKNVLYGKNGIHMHFFKKNLKKWGSLENLPNNKKYFRVMLS